MDGPVAALLAFHPILIAEQHLNMGRGFALVIMIVPIGFRLGEQQATH